jgi:hypothetical protein
LVEFRVPDFATIVLALDEDVSRRIMQTNPMEKAPRGAIGAALEDTLHPGDRLEKIVIAASYRKQLQFDLDYYGVNRHTLFPGLEGLSTYVNWIMAHLQYWRDSPLDSDIPEPNEGGPT